MLKAIAERIDKLEIDIIAITQALGAIHEGLVIMKERIEVQEYR